MSFYQPKDANFRKLFGSSFYVQDTLGDGSCLFHSIATATFGSEYDSLTDTQKQKAGHELRLQLKDKITIQHFMVAQQKIKQKQQKMGIPYTEISYTEFQKKMGDTKVWADTLLISVLSMVLDYNVLFYDLSTTKDFYRGVDRLHKLKTSPTIFIAWRDKSHFELIVQRLNPNTKKELRRRQFFWNKDKKLLNRIKHEYER